MDILNDKLTPIFNTYFNHTTTDKLSNLVKQITQFGKVETRNYIF